MNPGLRRSTLALLASSLLLTIGRGATLPFMTIYLNRQYVKRGELFKIDLQLIQDNQKRHNGELFKIKSAVV